MKLFLLMASFLLPVFVHAFLNPPQIISLIPQENNLENENLIEQLCPKSAGNFETCKKEKMKSQVWILNVYEKPEAGLKPIGKIQITGIPGRGLKAQYLVAGKAAVDFPSDSKGTDWGYSCYFEFTVSNVIDDWTQLPKRPFAEPVWINVNKDWPKIGDLDMRPKPRTIGADSVFQAGTLGNIVFKKFSGKTFIYRKENANDMSCGNEPKKIPASQLKESTKPISILYDSDGHLIAWPAYCRGC